MYVTENQHCGPSGEGVTGVSQSQGGPAVGPWAQWNPEGRQSSIERGKEKGPSRKAWQREFVVPCGSGTQRKNTQKKAL